MGVSTNTRMGYAQNRPPETTGEMAVLNSKETTGLRHQVPLYPYGYAALRRAQARLAAAGLGPFEVTCCSTDLMTLMTMRGWAQGCGLGPVRPSAFVLAPRAGR